MIKLLAAKIHRTFCDKKNVVMTMDDHPNEISAYMLSQLFEARLHGEVPFSNASQEAKKACKQYLLWVDEEISNKNSVNISLQ